MTIEYLKCRADLSFEVDFGVNDAIGMHHMPLAYEVGGMVVVFLW